MMRADMVGCERRPACRATWSAAASRRSSSRRSQGRWWMLSRQAGRLAKGGREGGEGRETASMDRWDEEALL